MICSAPEPGEGPVIFRYTRQQAIDDGVLVDLTDWARETGFTISVACTASVWHQWVVPPEVTRSEGQSERGRAHDLLWMLYVAIRRQKDAAGELLYEVIFLDARRRQQAVQLKAHCGPGDAGEPVITIMLPGED